MMYNSKIITKCFVSLRTIDHIVLDVCELS